MIPTEPRFISDNEQKLTVLYALHTLGPVTDHQLLTFLTVCDTMNWFSMKLGLVDLEDEGMIIRQAHPLGELWLVTDEGEFCLKQFSGRIPMSRRIILTANAPEWRRRFKSLQQSPAEAFTEPDGRVRLQLRLAEDNELLMDLMILLPAGTEIKDLGRKWEKTAPEIYRELLIRMQLETAGENRETVLLEEQDCSLLIMFPVNNETDREQIRQLWQENRNELVQKILKIL